jgi:hypothetical protein
MEQNDARNTSLCQNAARKAIAARLSARENPNAGTLSGARLKTLDFYRMMAKRRAARGRPDLRGAARAACEAKRLRAFGAAAAKRDEQYNNSHRL